MSTPDRTLAEPGSPFEEDVDTMDVQQLETRTERRREPGPATNGSWFARGGGALAVGTCVAGLFLSPSLEIAGAFVVVMMLVLMFMNVPVPVAVALAVPSVIGLYAISGVSATVNILSTTPYRSVSSWSLSVLPMFIFMGMLLTASGMTSRIYRATECWFGWLPGGAGIGTTAAGAGLASVSGSTIGMTYALGRAGIPEMLRAGYDRRVAVGTVLIAGLPGNLIPPSILLVVFAGLASVPVGPQLIAGTLPGVLLALCYAGFIFALCVARPSLFGRHRGDRAQHTVTQSERLKSLRDIWGFPVIMAVLFGGMFTGIFTPTEAGAAAALVSMLLCLWHTRHEHPLRTVAQAAAATVSATAVIFFLLVGAEMLTRVLAITGLARFMTDFIVGLGLSQTGFLLALVVLYLFMGMFFDTLSMLLLTVPILLPTLQLMNVDILWFGVFVVLLGELGMITPPVGVLSYVVHSISQKPEVNLGQAISLRDVFTAAAWFLPISVLFLVGMIFFPAVATWLPSLM